MNVDWLPEDRLFTDHIKPTRLIVNQIWTEATAHENI